MFTILRDRIRQAPRARLGVARLEDRAQPSVTASVTNGTLFVSGSADSPQAEIRIAGSNQLVQVFDGQKSVAFFRGVANIDARPDAGTDLAVDLTTNNNVANLTVRLADDPTSKDPTSKREGSAVRIGQGQVGSATIIGSSGDERVTVNGLSAGRITADLGAGNDELTVTKSSMKALSAVSTESVGLASSSAFTVGVENATGAAAVTLNAAIAGNVNVMTRGGSLTVGGIVGGDVYFNADLKPTAVATPAATMTVSGEILGGLSVSGTSQGDTVTLTKVSRVAGNVAIDLRAGNDAVIFAGEIGNPKSSTAVVNLGDGDDILAVKASARLQAGKAAFLLGDGNDLAQIEMGATLTALYLDGGAGKDTYLNAIGSKGVVDDVNFEITI